MRTNRTDSSILAELELIFLELEGIRREIWELRREVCKDKETIMSALTDLQTAVGALITEAVTDLELVLAKIGTTPPDDTAALQELTQKANDAIAKLKADTATLTTPAPTTSTTTDPTSPPSA